MVIKIIAIAREDGWAFILEEENLFLLRPPYTSSNKIKVSESTVENAVHLHGFEECDLTFLSISEVVRFLNEEYVKSKRNQGIDLPTSKEMRELLEYTTDDILLELVNRAKNELIPEGKIAAAEDIALELMKLEKVRNNPEMIELIREILEICIQRPKINQLEMEILDNLKEHWPIKFPNAVKEYSMDSLIKFQKRISTSKTIIIPG